jgi:hypothetical protein
MRVVALLVLLGAAGAACTQTTELLGASTVTCTGKGPAIHLAGNAPQNCTGALAARFGRYALCSCNTLNLASGGLYVNVVGGPPPGPRPTGGPGPGAPAPRLFAASVGTDGDLVVGSAADPPGPMTEIAGSLVTAGMGRATFVHGGHVQGNLRGAGSFTTATTMGVWVSGEMVSGGDVSGMYRVVGGPLRLPPGAMITPDVQSMGVSRETVAVPPPCGCGASPALDLRAEIAARKPSNTNPSFPEDLLSDVQKGKTLDLTCGEYYLQGIESAVGAPITLRVHGRVALFVAGAVRLGDSFAVALEDDADELDLIVGGPFDTMGRVFGSPSTPARMRLWAASNMVALPDQIQFGAAVYAPNAVFSAGANLSFFGSLYVGALQIGGDVRVAYDPSVLFGGEACGVAPPQRVE